MKATIEAIIAYLERDNGEYFSADCGADFNEQECPDANSETCNKCKAFRHVWLRNKKLLEEMREGLKEPDGTKGTGFFHHEIHSQRKDNETSMMIDGQGIVVGEITAPLPLRQHVFDILAAASHLTTAKAVAYLNNGAAMEQELKEHCSECDGTHDCKKCDTQILLDKLKEV